MIPIQVALLLLQAGSPALSSIEPVLDRVIERAQQRLTRDVELWEDHSTWENAWQVETEHYLVRSTSTRYLTADLAEGLESMLALFRDTLRTDPAWQPREPFRVHVLPSLSDYKTFGDEHGAEHSSFYGSFYPAQHADRAVVTYFVGNPTLARMWVTHSAFHQFLDRAYARPLPPVLAEGLASYFALWWKFDYGVEELAKMKRDGRMIPLADLSRGDLASFADRTHDRLIQLGMLVAYLLHYHPETRTVVENGEVWQAAFSEYLDVLLTGDDAELHPVSDLLTTRLDELEADFLAFDFPTR